MPALLVALILLVGATTPLESWTATAARTIVVRGTVTDSSSSKPIVGAHVQATSIPYTLGHGQTAADGSYSFSISVADSATMLTIRVRAIGFKPAVVAWPIKGDSVTANFALVADPTRLEAIVVTGTVEGRSQSVASFHVAPATQPAAGTLRLRGSGAVAWDNRWNTEEYARIEDNRWISVASSPLSTFSADVDRASYTNVRRHINQGTLPPKDAVRIEEMINYFRYNYDEPAGAHPIHIASDVTAAPWNPKHRIVRIGLHTKSIATKDLPPNNLVFLIDVSGSMQPANKLPLVKQAFRLLVNELREEDRVAIVVYAGAAGLVLPSTGAANKQVILDAIERLEAGGSTAGGAGIRLAYDVAKQNYNPEANNRVILATDGDFNVGISNTADLTRYVEERRTEGTYLTVLGFGMGNYKDSRLESFADKGNGNYAYVDDLLEARKVFVQEMGATLLTVAKDVKLQIEFNPATVQAYRLIGYENRMLRSEDFTDDKKDAGEIGAGHSVTALYEIVPVGVKMDVDVGTTGQLRYQQPSTTTRRSRSKELLFVNVRYKMPTASASRLMQKAVVETDAETCNDLRFAMAVAGYGMLLRDSEFKGKLTYEDVISLGRGAAGEDRERLDFVAMVERTRQIAAGVAQGSQR